jgi:hypothetical protein
MTNKNRPLGRLYAENYGDPSQSAAENTSQNETPGRDAGFRRVSRISPGRAARIPEVSVLRQRKLRWDRSAIARCEKSRGIRVVPGDGGCEEISIYILVTLVTLALISSH